MEKPHMERQECFPLSCSQQNIWAVEQACPNTPINNICTTLRIQGQADLAALQRSVNFVLSADPTLRTRITLRNKLPLQYHVPYQEEDVPVYDFSLSTQDSIHLWETTFTREHMPVEDAPLYRFALLRTGEHSANLVIKLHHLISDGWSQVMLCNRLGQCYLDFLSGRQPQLEELPGYQAHIEEESRYLTSSACRRDEEYWKACLEQSAAPAVLKPVRGASVSPVGDRLTFDLSEELNTAIYSYCMEHRVAPFSVFYMALAIYLRRTGGASPFTIGVPIFNRRTFADKQTSGMFVSTLPFCGEVSCDWSFHQFTQQMSTQWFDLLRHQRFPFSRIQALADRQGTASRLFHVALSYQNGQLTQSSDPTVSFSGRWHYSGYQLEQLCIHLSNLEDNRRYCVDYDYLTQVFSPDEIRRLHSCLVNILTQALASPDRPICELSLLDAAQREQVLNTFNRTECSLGENSLYELFSAQVLRNPNHPALIMDGQSTSYSQVEQTAAQVHAALSGLCREPDTLIAVLHPRTPALFSAMMGVLRSGGAFLLLSPTLPENRLREILTQSGAAAVLTTPEVGGFLGDQLPVIDLNRLPAPTSCAPAPCGSDALAYVVYTSGSTGKPKGVEISCGSLLNLSRSMALYYSDGPVLSVCSIGFDAFLLESICPLLNGRTILLPREEALESPGALARLMEEHRAGFLSTTPSRLSAWLKDQTFRAACAGLEHIICGGEAFPSELLQQLQRCTAASIYNQYGPSETTVAVSIQKLNNANTITAGIPMPNCRLYVLDQWGAPLPVGVYGELYIGGLCVGRGYRNAPQQTAEVYSADPFAANGRMYRTGDMACWTERGELLLAGRRDQQVKLRGLRIEPQEIADCISRHPGVLQSAAAVQQHNGQDILVGFYRSEQPISEEELLQLCAANLPHYMIPSAIVSVKQFPLTENGKVDRSALPHPELDSPSGEDIPATPLQEILLSIVRRVLNRPDMGVNSDYFLFGGNSLNAMETLSEIGEHTGRTLRVTDLYACRNVARLSALLEQEGCTTQIRHLLPAPPQERWPLTPIQQGIYVQSHLDPTGKTYHMAGAFRLTVKPDIPRLEQAIRAMIAQEPLLRTAFVSEADGIFARVLPQTDFVLPVFRGGTLEEASVQLLAPFCLDCPPLLRAALWEEGPEQWVLLFNTHHIIGDGLTSSILMSRLDALYQGGEVRSQPLSYLDYAWHQSRQTGKELHQKAWKEHLADLPEPLELPGDFPRVHESDFRGNTISHRLSPQLTQACDNFCTRKGFSPYTFFLGAFGILMSRLSGKGDILVGAAASGRLIPETRTMCGPFINTLPLRLNPDSSMTLEDYLKAVRDEVNYMLDHQQVGLEEIVSALGIRRTLSQSPLFQVIFSQRPIDASAFTLCGGPAQHIPLPTGTARMDLWTELSREEDCYVFHTEYATQLFREETVAYYGRCLETIAASMLREENTPLAQLEALSEQDRSTLIDIPNHTTTPFMNLPIRTQFEQRLAENPDAPAVIFHGQTISRRQLDRRACQIANQLAQAGVVPGCRIGIAMKRTDDLVAAVLAVWKTGGAYVPLLAHYPEQRLGYMAEISGMTHILCDEHTVLQLPKTLPCRLVRVSGEGEDTFSSAPLTEEDEAEILFTSGSTGRPKGVLMAWRSIANMAHQFRKILSQSQGAILCTTNIVFDMFNGEVVVPLSMGKTIVMADEEEMMLPWKLAEIIQRDGVTITQSTPSRVQMWLSNEAFRRACANLEMMMYGGEVVTETLLRQAQTYSNEAIQVNLYGPTEGTVYATTRSMDYRRDYNVGWPMDNLRAYVLDEHLRPVLPTAVGDLYLSGECVSVGYVNRPDLTEAAYLPDPFFPGARMYRTGDLGRLRLDGSYDFYGRRDAQVKLNGQRVELDEINGTFVSQNCALQAATVPVRREDGSMELFTYYIPHPDRPDNGEIRRRLSQVLPAYMLPSRMLPLQQMPSTPTGKINLRKLKEWAQSGEDSNTATLSTQIENTFQAAPKAEPSPATPPAGSEAEVGCLEWILALWRRVLSRKDVAPDRSFFEQGGTSLAALSILSYYNNKQLSLSLAQFYDNPTAAAQAALFAPEKPEIPAASAPQTAEIPVDAYSRQAPPLACPVADVTLDCVLLTGATGFLGAHLLRALLDQGAKKILCTMRDGKVSRLTEILTFYFGQEWVEDHADRLEVVCADLSKPYLNLSPADYKATLNRISSVWNCAADVRHYAADSEALMAVNLGGARNAADLARAANVPLYHMSTTSVGGSRLVDQDGPARFTEEDFHMGQNWQENLYVRSKFLAEHAVFEAARTGLTARVFRLGRLVGRGSDGLFQKNPDTNAFWLMMRGIHALGAIPASMAQMPMELTPIDWCAQAIVALRNAPHSVYHLQSPAPPTAAHCARAVAGELRVLPDGEFEQLLLSAPADSSGKVLSPLINQWNQLKSAPATIAVDSERTNRLLERAGVPLDLPGPELLLSGFHFPADHT